LTAGPGDDRMYLERNNMNKKTITGWSIAVTWSDGKRENILDIPDEVAQYIDDYLTEIEEHGDLAKPSTEFVRDDSL
jgi:hypothetical protein